jgi:D-alanyl-D-alanine carboxypeptidase
VGYLDETSFNPTLDAYSSGGQVSTAEDLAKFIDAVITEHFFRHPATLQSAMALPTFKSPPITAPVQEERKFRTHFMFFSFVQDGTEFIGHSGYWGAVMFYQPERGLVITGTGNQVDRKLPLTAIARAFAGQ